MGRLRDAFFDPASKSIHYVHTAAEILEGVEVTLVVLSSTAAMGETAGATWIGLKAFHLIEAIEHIGATTSEIGVASGALAGLFLPVTTGLAGMVGEFAAIGMGYHDAAEKISEDASVHGYAYGVVMGAMRELPAFVKDFWMRGIRGKSKNPFFEAGDAVWAKYFVAGIVRGYAEARELTPSQTAVLWQDLARRGGMIQVPLDASGNPVPTRNFYYEVANRFMALHVTE